VRHGRTTQTYDGVEYAPGRRFRVVREGLKLTGWQPKPGYQQGWGQDLHVGDVITCLGWGPGWGSDPGYGIEWTSEEAEKVRANSLDTWPSVGGAWGYRPPVGYLEPIEEDET
jgi:hypothetical protein